MSWEWGEVRGLYLDYLVVPMLLIWLGAVALMLSIAVAWQRVGPSALASGTLPLVASLAMVLPAAVFTLPCNSIMWTCKVPTPEQSAILGGMVAATSLPLWVHFVVATLVRSRRKCPRD